MLVVAVALLLLLLVLAAVFHVFLGWPLLLGVGIFALCAKGQGKTRGEIGRMAGGRPEKSLDRDPGADCHRPAHRQLDCLRNHSLSGAAGGAADPAPRLSGVLFLALRGHELSAGHSFGTANTVGMVLITIAAPAVSAFP